MLGLAPVQPVNYVPSGASLDQGSAIQALDSPTNSEVLLGSVAPLGSRFSFERQASLLGRRYSALVRRALAEPADASSNPSVHANHFS